MNSAGNTPSTSTTFGNNYGYQHENEPFAGKFTYGLGVSIGILVLITTITVTSYFCTRTDPGHSPTEGQAQGQHQQGGAEHVINIEGIDEETLKTYPKCLYSQLLKGSTTQNCCSVCLADYKGKDMVRELPECRHVFHVKCVDSWLRLNPTCPLCRTSPLPTPQSTPLAHVVPLASNLRGV